MKTVKQQDTIFSLEGRASADPQEDSDSRALPLFTIVSSNALQSNLIKSLLEDEFSARCLSFAEFPLAAAIERASGRPCLYLLDCQQSDARSIEAMLQLNHHPIPSSFMIALYGVDQDSGLAPLVKRLKIRGIFYQKNSTAVLIKGIRTILSGQMWLSRRMLSECVRMGRGKGVEPPAASLNLLTDREKEILGHVIVGESNQEIADTMRISLHTVKSHLYNIYKKIDVPNRLQGAMWAATYLRDPPAD